MQAIRDYVRRAEKRRYGYCYLFVTGLGILLIWAWLFGAVMSLRGGGSAGEPETQRFEYSVLKNYFKQDDPQTDWESFDFKSENFGLIDGVYDSDVDVEGSATQWERFGHHVNRMNKKRPAGVTYKVLFMGRHGEGVHNVAEEFYGTPAWDSKWSKLNGNGTVVWADAHLTQKGVEQAQAANQFWATQLRAQKMPAPERYYTSPLARCLETAMHTYVGLVVPLDRIFKPTVKELLREKMGEHTCDRRSRKTWIAEHYPLWPIEPGFTLEDELWDPDERESDEHIVARLKSLLDDVFTHDEYTFISFTSHSGAIAAILEAIGHRAFPLVTGSIIPVLVKAERV